MNRSGDSRTTKRIIIGIDFGTTFCSVSFAIHDWNPNSQQSSTIQLKPQSIQFDGGKSQVKTQIAWHAAKRDYIWGDEVDRRIRYQEIPEEDRIVLLKLGLDKSKDTEKIRKKQADQLSRIPRQPAITDLISILLERIYHFAKIKIVKICGATVGGNIFDSGVVQCAVCVPAIWTPEMNQTMVTAAEKAAIPNPDIVAESEAAAAFIMYEQEVTATNTGQTMLQLNDSFLVADIGGGTGDFITYVVETESPVLRMREGIAGTGGLCGSALLNDYFREFLAMYTKDLMPDFLRDLGKNNTVKCVEDILNIAVQEFEDVKKRFDSLSDTTREDYMSIHIPGIRENLVQNILPGRILVPSEHIRRLFQKIIDPIVRMIEQQIRSFNEKYYPTIGRKIKKIIFVGGLSGSDHVGNSLEKAFCTEARMGYSIDIMTPNEDSSTVISKGAVLRSMHKDAIVERYLRRSFGHAWDEQYDKNVHGDVKAELDAHDNAEVALNRIHWLFRLDEAVHQGCVQTMRGWRGIPLKGPFTLQETLYGSHQEKQDHLAVDDASNDIEAIGVIEIDVSNIDRRLLTREQNKRTKEWYLRMEYEIRVSFDYPRLNYEVIIPRNGKFPSPETWGDDPIRSPAVLNCAAVFEITKPQAIAPPIRPASRDQILAPQSLT